MANDKPFEQLPGAGTTIPKVTDDIKDKYVVGEEARRAAEIDSMYDEFIKIQTAPIVLRWSQFAPFAKLYNRAYYNSINIHDTEVRKELNALSNQLMLLINPQREFHVLIEEPDMEPFYLTFPAIYTPIKAMSNDRSPAVAILHNFLINSEDQPWKIRQATANFVQSLADSQDATQLLGVAEKTRIITERMKQSYATAVATQPVTATKTPADYNEESSPVPNEDLLGDFIMDDE